DGGLELFVQDGAVGDDDGLVEDGGVGLKTLGDGGRVQQGDVGGGVQGGESVREPGDGVGLARAGRVLDEVVVSGAVACGVGDHTAHGVPLVEAGEDDGVPLAPLVVLTALDVDEAFQQVEPVVDVPDRFPQVGGAVPALVGCRDRIARATGVPRAFGAGVEGQETGVLAGELGGEEHQV